MICAAGSVVLYFGTFSKEHPAAFFSNSPVPLRIAIFAIASWLLGQVINKWWWYFSTDEHEQKADDLGNLTGWALFFTVTPAWWVAARAGLSEACFHEHFGTTEECLLAALHSLAIRAHAQVFSCASGPVHPDPLAERRAWHEPHADRQAGFAHDPGDERLGCALACLGPILAATRSGVSLPCS